MKNARAEAARALAPVFRQEQSLQQHFEKHINALAERDRGLFHELVHGSLRQFEFLNALVTLLVKKPLKKKDADIHALLLLGLYQLNFMRVPDHAALSETVNAAAKLKKLWAKNFINASLRTYLREKSDFDARARTLDSARYLCPDWLLSALQQDWPEHWQGILEQNSLQPPISLRVNTQRLSVNDALERLEKVGAVVEKGSLSPASLILKHSLSPDIRAALNEGWINVQDEAAQLSAELLALEPHQRVLDACAAPGGKTAHIFERLHGQGTLVAVEMDEERAQHLEENLKRLDISAKLIVADAANTSTWWDGKTFDRILLDAPCSATGVIRRHPDIKLLRRAHDLAKLAEQQYALLTELWQLLKPGGILLYATCSILKQENEAVVDKFLQHHSDVHHDPIDANWGEVRPFGRQLFPKNQGHDGFYYARLKKKNADHP